MRFLFLSSILAMGMLRAPEPGDGGGGGGGTPAPKDAPPPDKPAPRTFTQDEVNAIVKASEEKALTKGQKAILAKLKAEGFDVDDEDKLLALVKSGDAARKATQSEIEKASESAKLATKKAEEAAAQLKAAAAENAKLRLMIEAKPTDVDVFDALYEKASREDGFDGTKWLAEQKAKRPTLFGAADAAPPPAKEEGATTTTTARQQTTTAGNGARRDVSKMNAQELTSYEAELGISR